MIPTASQAYLALDVLAIESTNAPQRLRAWDVIATALSEKGWTGRVEGGCVEYGRPPAEDPQAAMKVAIYDHAIEELAALPESQRAVDVDWLRKLITGQR